MPNQVVHWEIATGDARGAVEFYGKLFGWSFQEFPGMEYHACAGEGGSPGGGIMTTPPGGQPYLTVYVHVEDIEDTLARAAELGATTILPSQPVPGVGTVAMFADPQGTMIGLFKPEVHAAG